MGELSLVEVLAFARLDHVLLEPLLELVVSLLLHLLHCLDVSFRHLVDSLLNLRKGLQHAGRQLLAILLVHCRFLILDFRREHVEVFNQVLEVLNIGVFFRAI